ncbi:MAG: hypothetical protein A2020_01000 [Lentisphaerae bacterium GWF2_45_14]|nr:MAG: hypothetical protein A2020_01000 [Lentisphaerae bacterium GWF2_45_14]
MEKACLIIPCYNESARLDMAAFAAWQGKIRFIFVNDGSRDNTLEILKQHEDKSHIAVVDLKKNLGKAEAVRQGMLHAVNMPDFHDFDWYGYWDADMATPLSEIENFLLYRKDFAPKADVILGSRVSRLGSSIARSKLRYLTGRIFMNIFRALFKIKAYDTQCGAKLFRPETLKAAFEKPFISRWIFDLEVIMRLGDFKIAEYPLQKWKDIKGSKISSFGVMAGIIGDIIKLYFSRFR